MSDPVAPAVVVRKTFKYKLKPTPTQEQALEQVIRRGRTRRNGALDQRKTL